MRLRLDEERGWGERRHRPRYGGICGQQYRRWWRTMGRRVYLRAARADHGGFRGSNGARTRLWKWELRSWPPRAAYPFQCATCRPDEQVEQDRARLFSFISKKLEDGH